MGYKDPNLVADPRRDIGLSEQVDGRSEWLVGLHPRVAAASGHLRRLANPSRSFGSFLYLVFFGAILLNPVACGRHIGDACSSSADCDPTSGTRTCDLSQPGGYCLLEGCDARSCPGESVCIRVFPGALLSKSCSADVMCNPDEICLTDSAAATADAGAAAGSSAGYCARMSLEKRLCLQGCGGNGDCRSGYTCTQAGTNGTIALTLTASEAASTRYCAAVR